MILSIITLAIMSCEVITIKYYLHNIYIYNIVQLYYYIDKRSSHHLLVAKCYRCAYVGTIILFIFLFQNIINVHALGLILNLSSIIKSKI